MECGRKKDNRDETKFSGLRNGANGFPKNREQKPGVVARNDEWMARDLQMAMHHSHLYEETYWHHDEENDSPPFPESDHVPSLFPVLRLHGGVGHGDLCSFPPTELRPEAGCAADHDCYLCLADRDHLCRALSAL